MLPQNWVGKKIADRYQIDALLGQGGMSAVYRAVDPNLRRMVAIKLIHPHLSTNPKFLDRFKEEAAAVARLRHPNIVQVYDFSCDGDTYYMVMEYLEGETLQARLRHLNAAHRLLPVREALQICAQICHAAGYAHERGLIHRDIKPGNVMLNPGEQAILMDFGIVKIVGGEYHTATGATLGTAMYMAPEQFRGELVDERSDIYSVGVTLYEMLSGRPPYQADSALALMMKVLNEPLPDLREFRPELPAHLLGLVEKALAKDPSQRFQSMAEMAAALQQAQAHLEIPGPSATAVDVIAEKRAEAGDLPPQGLTQVDAPSSGEVELSGMDLATSHAPEVEAQAVEPASALPEAAAPGARSTSGLRPRLFILVVGLVILLLAGVIGVNQYLTTRRPPPLQLAPIARPDTPISVQSAPYVVNLGRWEIASAVEELAFSPDGALLGTANNREWVRFTSYRYYSALWRVEAGGLQKYLQGQSQRVSSVAFSPGGDLFASASDDGALYLWQVSDGSLVRKIEPSIGSMTSVKFSPSNPLLAAGSWDGMVGLWGLSDGQLLRTLQVQDIPVKDVTFSPDGMSLASAMEDNTVLLWRVSDGSRLYTLSGHTAPVHKVAFSPDGALLASASEDKTIRLWQASDGSLLRTLPGHSEPVYDLAFSPDGSVLASGSLDRTLRLWQVRDGQILGVLGEQPDEVLSLAFSPDGRLLVSGSTSGGVYFWGLSAAIPLDAGATPSPPP